MRAWIPDEEAEVATVRSYLSHKGFPPDCRVSCWVFDYKGLKGQGLGLRVYGGLCKGLL